ncbi:MAG: DUF4058 family protein [Chloroflexaceae bacterium]
MPTPFPGMDPYLERPGLWEEVHAGLIVAIQQYLSALLRPRYRVAIERRTYLALLDTEPFAGKPDVLLVAADDVPPPTAAPLQQTTTLTAELPMPEEVVERFLEIREVATGAVITVIELLAPTNKLPGAGRLAYERKRLRLLASASHLVEIDLLRTGPPLPLRLPPGTAPGDYRMVISRAPQRPTAEVLLFRVRDPIPALSIPLQPGEPEPQLPLNQVLHTLYDNAGYDLAVDYRQPPDPPLTEADAAWATTLLG